MAASFLNFSNFVMFILVLPRWVGFKAVLAVGDLAPVQRRMFFVFVFVKVCCMSWPLVSYIFGCDMRFYSGLRLCKSAPKSNVKTCEIAQNVQIPFPVNRIYLRVTPCIDACRSCWLWKECRLKWLSTTVSPIDRGMVWNGWWYHGNCTI